MTALSNGSANGSCNGSGILPASQRYRTGLEHWMIRVSLERVIVPVWIIVGLPGALAALAVWLQKHMRFSSSVYLAALAVLDLLFLLMQISWYLHEDWNILVMNTPVFCETFAVFNYALQYASPVLTLSFSVERFISVCYPFQRERWCSVRRAQIVTLAVCLLAIVLASAQGYFYRFNGTECMARAEFQPSLLVTWYAWSIATEMIHFALVPFAILVLNIRVIVEMRRIDTVASRQTLSTTVMLLCVSFYLIFTHLPVTACYVMYLRIPTGDECFTDAQIERDPQWQRFFLFNNARVVIDCFARSYYAAKFYIYMATGRQFRAQFVHMFCPQRVRMAGCMGSSEDEKCAHMNSAAVPLVNRSARLTRRQDRDMDTVCVKV